MLIHFYPPLCNPLINQINEAITCNKNINEVTCPKCVYYYFHPEARILEFNFQLNKGEVKS